MKYKEFLQTIETEIKKKLEDGYSLKIHPVKKNNGKIYDGLLIINPSFNIAPAIYLNPYYHWYLDGVSINDIVDHTKRYFQNRILISHPYMIIRLQNPILL